MIFRTLLGERIKLGQVWGGFAVGVHPHLPFGLGIVQVEVQWLTDKITEYLNLNLFPMSRSSKNVSCRACCLWTVQTIIVGLCWFDFLGFRFRFVALVHRNLGACVFHVSDFHWFSEKGARVGKFLSEVMHVSWIIVPGFSNEAHEYLNNWLNWKSNFESCYVVDLCHCIAVYSVISHIRSAMHHTPQRAEDSCRFGDPQQSKGLVSKPT